MSARRGVEYSMRMYYLKKRTLFDTTIGSQLPPAYKKFWAEWKQTTPAPVHYIATPGKYRRNEETGEVFPVQNIPLPLKFPPEMNKGIWGGEAVIKGFQKRSHLKRRVPHFWFPTLKRSVVYSEVLDKYMNIVVTEKTMDLIHENYGFDHYLLKTKACDLKSTLAFKIKRQILKTLSEKTLYPNDPEKRDEVYAKYEQYLSAYTPEDIDWYGLSWLEACRKMTKINEASKVITPLKVRYRAELLSELKATERGEEIESEEPGSSLSWLSKLNPMSKSTET